jgi:hypothetical protein
MNKNDPEYKKLVEETIREESGDKAVSDPLAEWNQTKEKNFLDEYENLVKNSERKEKIYENDEVVVIDKLFTKNKRVCEKCKKSVLGNRDTIYITKHKVCEKCFIIHYEGR